MSKLLILENKSKLVKSVAEIAVQSLLDEVNLTPKPGLVDQLDSGAHDDMSLDQMRASANSLEETFLDIATISYDRKPSQDLREEIAAIGRNGEKRMYEVTNGVNTHKGAIWAIGLLVSAFSTGAGKLNIDEILNTAGKIARFPDRYNPNTSITNGNRVKKKFRVDGAKEQAEQGFPHIRQYSIPALIHAKLIGMPEEDARKYSLLSLIAHLDDTCILHRGGMEALVYAKNEAKKILKTETLTEMRVLNQAFIERNISPGGSADLLAATLFLEQSQILREKLQK